jgi:hypothetical protein
MGYGATRDFLVRVEHSFALRRHRRNRRKGEDKQHPLNLGRQVDALNDLLVALPDNRRAVGGHIKGGQLRFHIPPGHHIGFFLWIFTISKKPADNR